MVDVPDVARCHKATLGTNATGNHSDQRPEPHKPCQSSQFQDTKIRKPSQSSQKSSQVTEPSQASARRQRNLNAPDRIGRERARHMSSRGLLEAKTCVHANAGAEPKPSNK